MYDAVIGRFTTIDPAKQCYCPYVGMGNSPVVGIDSNGGTCETCPDGQQYDQYRDSNLDYAYSDLVSGDGVYQMLAEVQILSEPGALFKNDIRQSRRDFLDHPVTQGGMFIATSFVGAEACLLSRMAQRAKITLNSTKLGVKILYKTEMVFIKGAGNGLKTIVESQAATKVLDKLKPSIRKKVDEALDLVHKGLAGGNQHDLVGDLKGYKAIDIKGRRGLRMVYKETDDELIIHSIQDYHKK